MKAIINGKVITNNKIEDKVVLIQGEKILDLCDRVAEGVEIIDAKGLYVSPGFIDIHIHGYKGFEVMENTYESLINMSNDILATGVTGFVAATMTDKPERIREVVYEAKRASLGTKGADLLGIHLEGPFISREYKGAHREEYILNPSVNSFKDMCGGNESFVRVVTLAPELGGSGELIEHLKSSGIVPSMGHTAASYDEGKEGILQGIKSCTHVFNAMRGFLHREPGALGAVLDSDIAAECIADGVHVHEGALRILMKQKGIDKIVLVTDSMMGAGLEDGQYTLGGQKVYVEKAEARLENGMLAGSVLTMDRAVGNIKKFCHLDIAKAVSLATINPAKLLGLVGRGIIDKGYRSDILIFDENINIYKVIKDGTIKWTYMVKNGFK